MKPKVSIIVPVYNVEKYLDRCMESLLNQTLKDIEIILVDDGSPDSCPQMCDEYAKRDSRIKVIHKQNGGLGFARNSGLEIAKGEYVAFVDSDDHIALEMYEELICKANENNYDAVFGGIYIENDNKKWKHLHEFEHGKVFTNDDVKEFALEMVASKPYVKKERCCQMSVWRAVYKKNIITSNNISFISEREVVSEDIPFNVDFLLNAKKIALIDKAYYYYHLNGTSLTSNVNPQKFYGYINLRKILIGKLSNFDRLHVHSNRFFIGYCRMLMLQLCNSNRSDIKEQLSIICNDKIWDVIRKEYPVKWLPIYPRIIYSLTLSKNIRFLFIVNTILSRLKIFCGKRL